MKVLEVSRTFFYVIGNSFGIPYYIKRHCVPESAVRGEEYIAVLSAHAPKCASSAHFVLERISKKYQKNEKKVLTDVGRDDIIYKLSARTTRNGKD